MTLGIELIMIVVMMIMMMITMMMLLLLMVVMMIVEVMIVMLMTTDHGVRRAHCVAQFMGKGEEVGASVFAADTNCVSWNKCSPYKKFLILSVRID